MGGIVVAIYLHRAQLFDAGGVGGHDDHRMALVFWRVIAGAHHDDMHRTARIARTCRPPFFAVQHVIVAVGHAGHRDIGRVRTGHIRFRHQIGGADITRHQRFQPAVLHRLGAVAGEDLHVAGVGGVAVEHLGGKVAFAHFLGQIGVFDGVQLRAVAEGVPEVPEFAVARLGFQPFKDFGLARCERPAVAHRDLGQKFRVKRRDLIRDHCLDRRQYRLQPLCLTQIHP